MSGWDEADVAQDAPEVTAVDIPGDDSVAQDALAPEADREAIAIQVAILREQYGTARAWRETAGLIESNIAYTLCVMAIRGEIPQAEICRITGLSKSNVSRMVDRAQAGKWEHPDLSFLGEAAYREISRRTFGEEQEPPFRKVYDPELGGDVMEWKS